MAQGAPPEQAGIQQQVPVIPTPRIQPTPTVTRTTTNTRPVSVLFITRFLYSSMIVFNRLPRLLMNYRHVSMPCKICYN